MKSNILGILYVCIMTLWLFVPGTIRANSELDQSFIPSTAAAYQGNIIKAFDGSYVDQAQTFTVGITGTLTNVEVLIW